MFPTLDPTAISTLLMITLLGIGLFFFIRASGKDRVETRLYLSQDPLDTTGSRVKAYFLDRHYALADRDPSGIATFVGQAQPSLFVSGLLTLLAALGLACLAMVIETLQGGRLAWALMGLAPVAGDYYRHRNNRTETIRLRIEAQDPDGSRIHISGHRDELDELEQTLSLDWAD